MLSSELWSLNNSICASEPGCHKPSKEISPEQSCNGQPRPDSVCFLSLIPALSTNLLWDFSICGVPYLDVATGLALPACPPPLPALLILQLVWVTCLGLLFSRATMCNKESAASLYHRVRHEGLGVLWPGSGTATCAILWSLLSDLSSHTEGDTDKACSQLWSHLKALAGWCAKCFASAEGAWRRVESCQNPSGSNLISSPGA